MVTGSGEFSKGQGVGVRLGFLGEGTPELRPERQEDPAMQSSGPEYSPGSREQAVHRPCSQDQPTRGSRK